jgi:hypothetical protein
VFLLGAGASVKAGVPDTHQFVAQFIESLRGDSLQETVKRLVGELGTWAKKLGRDVDIEMLLETFTGLKDKGLDPAMGICRGDGDDYLTSNMLHRLITKLKDFIKAKAIVSERSVDYLDPLRGFLLDQRPVDIVSVNYDTCMEQFCSSRRLALEDGFDVRWNAANFAREHTDFRLYKLHGSVTWFQSDRGGYLKLPVMTPESQIELISGEKAQNLMLYPMQKWGYAEPLLELLLIVKHTLESEECRFLVAAGYSFRDEHVRTILWDAARRNQAMHVILVDPQANHIYTSRLKYYDADQKVPTPLDKHVVCLPYKFEEALPLLRTHFLHNLRVGLQEVSSQRTLELEGKNAHWQQAINMLSDAEHRELLTDLLPRFRLPSGPGAWSHNLAVTLKLAWSLRLNGLLEPARDLLQKLRQTLIEAMLEHLWVEVESRSGHGQSGFIRVYFGYVPNDTGGASMMADTSSMLKQLDPLVEFCRTHERMAMELPSDLRASKETLEWLADYCRAFGEGIDNKSYVELRAAAIPDKAVVNTAFHKFSTRHPDGIKVKDMVTDIEKRVIAGILDKLGDTPGDS